MTPGACADQVVYYLDLDGDGYGVDDAEWNQYCCSGAMPSAMYTTVSGDIRPNDPTITTALVQGCTFSEACNYNAAANVYDGSCLFPTDCRVCAGDGSGYDPSGPCSCDENGDPEYSDALGVCGGDCAEDTDGDGICDLTDGGETIDPCLTPGEVLDDCGNCATEAAGRYFTTSDNQPCNPETQVARTLTDTATATMR